MEVFVFDLLAYIDAGMAAEGEEIGVAGDDQIGLRCGCEGQDPVV